MAQAFALASLEVSGPQGNSTIALESGSTWRIGRLPQHEVALDDVSVSRNHAMLQRTEDGQFYLIDMGSRNGSFVNEARVSVPRALNDGDSIIIGEHVLVFRFAGPKAPLAEQGTLPGGGTSVLFTPQLLTVLVVDVRDFTKLTQQIEANVLSNLIATWFSRGGRLMSEHGSWSQKYIGDALMAVWLHKVYGNERKEILSIIQACLEFAEFTSGLQNQFSLAAPLRVGAGINTGFATVGNAGTGAVDDFTALGDTVNAAFRLESSTKELGVDVALGKSTYTTLNEGSSQEEYFEARKVFLKGYELQVEVWGARFEAVRGFLDAQGAQP